MLWGLSPAWGNSAQFKTPGPPDKKGIIYLTNPNRRNCEADELWTHIKYNLFAAGRALAAAAVNGDRKRVAENRRGIDKGGLSQ
jgi:hypothetical protein